MVNPRLGLGLVGWKSFLELPPAFTHIPWSPGLNHRLLGAHYIPGPVPGTGESEAGTEPTTGKGQ